jgi:hypothetical protein
MKEFGWTPHPGRPALGPERGFHSPRFPRISSPDRSADRNSLTFGSRVADRSSHLRDIPERLESNYFFAAPHFDSGIYGRWTVFPDPEALVRCKIRLLER